VRHLSFGFALVLLAAGSARAAEHDWPLAPRARELNPRFSFSLRDQSGVGTAPLVTRAFPEASGFATVLTGTAAMHFSSFGWLRLRLPVSYVRLDFPAGAQVGETSLGNLEIAAEHTVALASATRLGLVLGVLAPSAQGGPAVSLLDNRALALANAIQGNRDALLLTPGVTGLRLSASLEHSHPPFDFRASVDLPVLVRISDAELPDESRTSSLGLLPALDVRGAWWFTGGAGASLGAALLAEPARVQEPDRESDRAQRLQPVVSPGLHLQVGQRLALSLGGTIPVAGALGGEAWGIDLQGRFAF